MVAPGKMTVKQALGGSKGCVGPGGLEGRQGTVRRQQEGGRSPHVGGQAQPVVWVLTRLDVGWGLQVTRSAQWIRSTGGVPAAFLASGARLLAQVPVPTSGARKPGASGEGLGEGPCGGSSRGHRSLIQPGQLASVPPSVLASDTAAQDREPAPGSCARHQTQVARAPWCDRDTRTGMSELGKRDVERRHAFSVEDKEGPWKGPQSPAPRAMLVCT